VAVLAVPFLGRRLSTATVGDPVPMLAAASSLAVAESTEEDRW
jgi:hypothetical protein